MIRQCVLGNTDNLDGSVKVGMGSDEKGWLGKWWGIVMRGRSSGRHDERGRLEGSGKLGPSLGELSRGYGIESCLPGSVNRRRSDFKILRQRRCCQSQEPSFVKRNNCSHVPTLDGDHLHAAL